MTNDKFHDTVAKLASSPLKLAMLGKQGGMPGEQELVSAVGAVIGKNLKPGGTAALKRALMTTGLMAASTAGGMILKDLITDITYGNRQSKKKKEMEEIGKLTGQREYKDSVSTALQPKQDDVYRKVITQDEILSDADPEMLKSTFSTMRRFAPSLASDPNAVRSFLRESATYGTGPNYAALKNLAEAERAVSMGS